MYEDTPNKEEIDWIAERVRKIYDYERLKDCDIDFLYNQEFGMRADAQIFEAIFPAEESPQGPARAFLLDEENADREALTEAEKLRLHMLKKEAEIEIRRAFGHRKELRREHRNKLANSVSDALSPLGSLFPWG
ncbi:hypothetical protein [Halomicrococcus sp. SG-WS-1]|uniref:hypothetical protein n=1 Tax=Halomicrococcus sp. SG-WS-1 TaxID=3439057 RepID=UPI003F7995BD